MNSYPEYVRTDVVNAIQAQALIDSIEARRLKRPSRQRGLIGRIKRFKYFLGLR